MERVDRPQCCLAPRPITVADRLDLHDAFGQREISTIFASANQYKLILEEAPELQSDVSALSRIYLTSNNGARVPLTTVAQPQQKGRNADHQSPGPVSGGDIVLHRGAGFSLGQAVERIQSIERDLRTPITLQGSF